MIFGLLLFSAFPLCLLPFTYNLIYSTMSYNYSYTAGLPAAWLLSCHWYAVALTGKSPELKKFDNRSPREFLAKVTAIEKKSEIVKRYLRAEGANANGVEALPVFLAALVAGNAARLPADVMNKFVITWVGLRALYNVLYIGTNSGPLSGLRSITYLGALWTCVSVFIKAGRVLNGQIV